MFFHCFSKVNWRWRYGLYTSLVLKIDFCFLLLATGSYSKNRLSHAFDAILGLYGTLCYVQYYISGLAIVGFVFVNQIHDLHTSYTCACIETCCRARTNSKGFYRCMFSLFPHVISYCTVWLSPYIWIIMPSFCCVSVHLSVHLSVPGYFCKTQWMRKISNICPLH